MKTKRRHELQTNELADWLGHQIEAIRPYRQYIVGAVLAVVVLIGFVIYQSSARQKQKAAAWRAYMTAMSEGRPEQLDQIAQAYPDSNAALLALQAAGDIYLAEGSRLVYTDRETANDTLKKAVKNFDDVLKRADQDFLKNRAHLGLAQSYEALNELGQAREHYEVLASDTSDELTAKLAAHSIKRLNDPQTIDVFRQLSGEIIDPAIEYPDLPQPPDLSFPGDSTALADWPADGQLILQSDPDDPDDADVDPATATDEGDGGEPDESSECGNDTSSGEENDSTPDQPGDESGDDEDNKNDSPAANQDSGQQSSSNQDDPDQNQTDQDRDKSDKSDTGSAESTGQAATESNTSDSAGSSDSTGNSADPKSDSD